MDWDRYSFIYITEREWGLSIALFWLCALCVWPVRRSTIKAHVSLHSKSRWLTQVQISNATASSRGWRGGSIFSLLCSRSLVNDMLHRFCKVQDTARSTKEPALLPKVHWMVLWLTIMYGMTGSGITRCGVWKMFKPEMACEILHLKSPLHVMHNSRTVWKTPVRISLICGLVTRQRKLNRSNLTWSRWFYWQYDTQTQVFKNRIY